MAKRRDFRKIQYVVEFNNCGGGVYKKNGEVVLIDAPSREAAAEKFYNLEGCSGDWDIRVAGDEPRIEAIEGYADMCHQVGVLDRQIAELNDKRRELVDSAEAFRKSAYQLPEDPEK